MEWTRSYYFRISNHYFSLFSTQPIKVKVEEILGQYLRVYSWGSLCSAQADHTNVRYSLNEPSPIVIGSRYTVIKPEPYQENEIYYLRPLQHYCNFSCRVKIRKSSIFTKSFYSDPSAGLQAQALLDCTSSSRNLKSYEHKSKCKINLYRICAIVHWNEVNQQRIRD